MAFVKTKFEEPEIVEYARFDKHGDAVEGLFAGTMERKNNFGKNEVQIHIKTGTAEDGTAMLTSVRANIRLLAQIAPVKRGSLVRIEYVDDKPNDGVDREGRPMAPTKMFDVLVDDGKAASKAAPNGEAKAPF